jgi:hypothetical protein
VWERFKKTLRFPHGYNKITFYDKLKILLCPKHYTYLDKLRTIQHIAKKKKEKSVKGQIKLLFFSVTRPS